MPRGLSLTTAATISTAYTLRWRQDGSGPWTELVLGAVLTRQIGSLVNGTTYEVQVLATNGVGSSAYSQSGREHPSTTPQPTTPPMLTRGNGQLVATWADPSNDGGDDISAWTIQWRENGTADPWTDATLGVVNTYTIIGLTNGTEYEAQVRSTNRDGNSLFSNSGTGTPATLPGAPDAPTLTRGDEQLVIVWAEPDDTGGGVTGYDIDYASGGGQPVVVNVGDVLTHTQTAAW